MRTSTKLVGAAVVVAAACVTAIPAMADDFVPLGTATIKNVSDVQAGVITYKGHQYPAALVSFQYSCSHVAKAEDTHLFVAVKQGPNVQVGSTSADAVSFYSTNWDSDHFPNALNCDGAKHTMNAAMTYDTYWNGTNHHLQNGQAFLQICLYDASGLTMNYSDAKVIVRN
jgi:hypothetical protein